MIDSTARVVFAVVVCAAPAAAGRGSIDAGLRAFEELDYARAVALLQQAYGETLETGEKVTVLRTLAFAHVALDQDDQARAEFRLLLRIEPTAALDETISPRTRLVFEEARAELGHPLPEEARPSPPPPLAASPPPVPWLLTPLTKTDAPRPLYRRGWIWGTAAGATAAIVLIGVIAGMFAEPATAKVTVAHP